MMRRVFLLAALMLVLGLGTAHADTRKVIRCATACELFPMEFLDGNRQPAGFTTDLLAALSEELGIRIEQSNVAWDGIFTSVAAGKFDIVASTVTVTEERKKAFLFTEPYYKMAQAVVMPRGKSIKSLADLKGLKVGGQTGTTGIFVIEKAMPGCNLREYDDINLAMEELRNGRIDAVVCDDILAGYYANVENGFENSIHVVYRTPQSEDIAILMNKKDTELCAILNDGIRRIQANGKYDAVVRKWMGASWQDHSYRGPDCAPGKVFEDKL